MKLILIHPYFNSNKGFSLGSPPISLGFLGTYILNNSDVHVEIVDPIPQKLSEEDVVNKCEYVDFIGLTCTTAIRFQCFNLARKIKEKYPNKIVIVGGAHVNSLDKLILEKYPSVDIIVRGEGEKTLLEIVKSVPLDKISGITYKENNKIIRNEDRPFIKNIDSLYCDNDLMLPQSFYSIDDEIPNKYRNLKTTTIVSSRGCPFKCTFCSSSACWKGTYRQMSAEDLFYLVSSAYVNDNIRFFKFFDSLFTGNREKTLKFCNLIKESDIKIHFKCEIRSGTTEEVIKALKESGCVAVSFGIESGSDRILEQVNKSTTRAKIEETIKLLKKYDIWTIGFFMNGFKGETEEDYKKSLELVKKVDSHSFSTVEIFPDIAFFQELKDNKEVTDNIWFDETQEEHICYSKEKFPEADFTLEELEWRAQKAFYTHNIYRPISVIKKYGLIKGTLAILKAVVDMPLHGRIHKLYLKLL